MPTRVVLAYDVHRSHVDAVIGVQVTEQHSVNRFNGRVLLQSAKRPVAEIEQHPKTVMLDEIARSRRIWAGKGP